MPRLLAAGIANPKPPVYLFKDFEIPMSFSAGVAEYMFEMDHDIDDVISRADKELYLAKAKRKQGNLD